MRRFALRARAPSAIIHAPFDLQVRVSSKWRGKNRVRDHQVYRRPIVQTGCHVDALETRRLLSVQSLGDVNTAPVTPTDVGEIAATGNGTVFFSADDGVHSRQLWRLLPDGGAAMLTNVPGAPGAKPTNLAAVGDTLYFSAFSPGAGEEFWKSDGTEAGTVMVADLQPGAQSSRPYGFVRFGDAVYFIADRSQVGRAYELWRTDGTAAGTTLVRPLQPPPGVRVSVWTRPPAPAVAAGRLFVGTPDTSSAGTGVLWVSDGTARGTVPLNYFPGPGGPDRFAVTAIGTLFFGAPGPDGRPHLWRTDGTRQGTIQLGTTRTGIDGITPDPITVSGNNVYFRADDGTSGSELWTSDGTEAGTRRVSDIRPGASGSVPDNVTAAGGIVYFTANDGTHGVELWRSDGTDAGTAMVTDLVSGSASGNISRLAASGPSLYFVAADRMYHSDGTAAGTIPLRRFTNSTGLVVGSAVPVGADAYFFANDAAAGASLWRTDGTPAGTTLAADVDLRTRTSFPRFLGAAGPAAYFFAEDPAHGQEVWKTDGTPAGTSLVRDINPGAAGAVNRASNLRGAPLGGVLYFGADDGTHGYELWRTDGTEPGTYLVKNISPDGATAVGSLPTAFTPFQNAVYFVDALTGWLYRTDGTETGTVRVSDKARFTLHGVVNGRLLLSSFNPRFATELWVSNGTDAGTTVLKDIGDGNAPVMPAPPVFTRDGAVAYFFASDNAGGNALWKTDGTPDGTVRVADAVPGADDLGGGLAVVGDRLFFAHSATAFELWVSDGTTGNTRRVRQFTAAETPTPPDNFVAAGDLLLFRVGSTVWRSDGTEAGTFKVAAVATERGGSAGATTWFSFGPNAYFSDTTGDTLWKSDGTVEGTVPVSDLFFKSAGSPTTFMPLGRSLLFSADDLVHGTELWRLTPDESAPAVTEARLVDGGASGPQRLEFKFDQAMAPPLQASLAFSDTSNGRPVAFTALPVMSGRSDVIAFTFPQTGGVMPAGSYRVTLRAASVSAADGDPLQRDYSFDFTAPPARVRARHVFDNQSAADGFNPGANVGDDKAVLAAQPLLPGGAPSGANVAGSARGINGVMIDVLGLPLQGDHPLTPQDFDIRVGDGSTWAPAPPTALITSRAGPGGTTRVTLLWPHGVVRNTWLRVTMLPTSNTGLSAPDVFYFGNLVGDTGDSAPGQPPTVNAADIARTRAHLGATDPDSLARYDFDGNGAIDAADLATVRRNQFHSLPAFSAVTVAQVPASTRTPRSRRRAWEQVPVD
jgi:ELWxxDGT repeat protein